ncbi:hypothetical protein H4582DRAFT_2073309 [Lactarius indigo]|nr:hypothetical protein H4582DRAFT_2073309 [Lactarius indigo]
MGDEKTPNSPQQEPFAKPPGGENNGGLSETLWSKCLEETEKEDNEMAERWKEEADTALGFVCAGPTILYIFTAKVKHTFKANLFAAAVAITIIESYKWLSADSGSQTVEQLDRLSEQFFNFSRGIPLEVVVPISTRAFKPDRAAVFVNISLFCCISICFTCSLAATLIQQAARRYLRITQGRGTPYERAQLRMYMFNGVRKFQMERLLLLLSMGLHLSILLFSMGIVGFIHRVYKSASLAALLNSCSDVSAYAVLTILPLIWMDSPIATPFTNIAWRLHHFSLLGLFKFIRVTLSAVRPRKPQGVSGSPWPPQWVEEWIRRHGKMASDGLQGTLDLMFAEGRPVQVDVKLLQDERRFTALVEKGSEKKIEDQDQDQDQDKDKDKDQVEAHVENIAAWVPEFFNAYTPPGFSETGHPLMSDQPSTIFNFGSRLHHLLKTCIPGAISDGRKPDDEEKRKRRLQTCLKCLWYWVKAPDTTRLLQAEKDPAADIRFRDAKLESLSAILGIPKEKVKDDLLGHPRAISLANISHPHVERDGDLGTC